MKHENDIIGKKIVSIESHDEYICAVLDNGMEIEISSILSKFNSEMNKKYQAPVKNIYKKDKKERKVKTKTTSIKTINVK